jgi:hypothetical protein
MYGWLGITNQLDPVIWCLHDTNVTMMQHVCCVELQHFPAAAPTHRHAAAAAVALAQFTE